MLPSGRLLKWKGENVAVMEVRAQRVLSRAHLLVPGASAGILHLEAQQGCFACCSTWSDSAAPHGSAVFKSKHCVQVVEAKECYGTSSGGAQS